MTLRIASFFRLSARELTALAVLFALSLPAVTLRFYASDEVEYFAYLRSLWFDRDVSFDNEYRHFHAQGTGSAGFADTFLNAETDTGLRRNFGTMGSALLWAPFYAVADAGVRAARAMGSGIPADGYSKPYVAAVCLGSAVYGFLAILLSARLARIVLGSGLGAALAVAAGTPLLFYMYVAPGFAHATSAFAVALFLSVWLHARGSWDLRGVVALAAAGALMTMVREQDAFIIAGPAVDALLSLRSSSPAAAPRGRPAGVRRALTLGIAASATFLLVLSPQLAAYEAINGRLGPSPLVGRKMTWTSPHALEVLLSPEHGFFLWTPLALLAFAGLVRLAASGREQLRVAIAMLVMFATTVYVTGSVESWTSAGGFGQRRFVNLTAILTVGVAALLGRRGARPARAATAAAIAVCVWWNLSLIAMFGAHLMDRQRLELTRNAYTSFVTLPRLAPQLAYRYLFDRASFYEGRRPQ